MKVVGTKTASCAELYRRIKRSELILPLHQRGNVWDSKKKESWWNKLSKGGTMAGQITTYNNNEYDKDTKSPIYYLNDGAQRVYYTLTEYANREDPDEFQRVLDNAYIVEQVAEYDSYQETISEFIALNSLGTICTPYELTRSIFVGGLQDYDKVWKPLFDEIHKTMAIRLAGVGCKYEDEKKNRTTAHKRMRDDLALFWRFATRDRSKKSFKVASVAVDTEWAKEADLELGLLTFLKGTGYDTIKSLVKSFTMYIDKAACFYKQIWCDVKPDLAAPSNVHFRWWLHVSIYAQNIGMDKEDFKEFTKKLITHTSGRTSVFYTSPTGHQCNCNTQLANLSNLSMIAKAVGCNGDLFVPQPPRSKSSPFDLIPGAVWSHVKAFSVHGNGEVLPENAIDNAHRGSRDMTEEEAMRLSYKKEKTL
jgi:hypothetical protein